MLAGDTNLLLRMQTEVLEAVARGMDLAEVGAILCRRVEHSAPGVLCSILLIEDGLIRTLAAPSLPVEYSSGIDGTPVGPAAGSCGTAAWRKQPVLVTDIATDPLWEDFRALALAHSLRACWSTPICNADGIVLGTFAFYYRTCRGPSPIERAMVDTCVHLCALAIDHDRVRARNQHLAYYDALTGLPNRGRFNELLADRIRAARPFGLIILDIDNLKLVNDSIGHAAGDTLIRTVARRLAGTGAAIHPCRLGGDEFAILVDDCADHAQLSAVSEIILDHATGMVEMSEQTIIAHVTMGGAVFGEDGTDHGTLCQNADFALYQAKQTHRGGYRAFRPDLRTAMIERNQVIRELDAAMTENRVIAHYQPIVRLDTGEIVGLEALARLVLPDGSLLNAGQFHAGLSDPRIAYQLTGQMLDQVARDIRTWLDEGIAFQHVGVNVTTGDFQRGDLAERMADIFDYHKVPLSHVLLEVNESVFMSSHDKTVPHAVEQLRSQGLLVALDDFGTGYASLTHLMSFPVDVIKIDRSFTERLGINDQPGEVVVRAILEIARRLGMKVVAEGIETARQAEVLRDLGCELGQGYRFSRPVSAPDTTHLLRAFAQRMPGPKTKSARKPHRVAASGH